MGGNASMTTLADDPVVRFEKLLTNAAPIDPALTPAELRSVIDNAGARPVEDALTNHVAAHSNLTAAQAQKVITKALAGAPAGSQAKATAVSSAVAGATGASADIELSDPVMLQPWARALSALLLFVVLALCVVFIHTLGKTSSTPGSALVSLAVVGVLSLVGILVLVMGYKNVSIKGGPPTGGSS